MIIQRDEPDAPAKSERELEVSPIRDAVCEAAAASPVAFQVSAAASGLELAVCSEESGHQPGRARMKVFSPQPGRTAVFFYKQSLVPYSRDRYSYGGIDLRSSQPTRDEIEEWLAFLSSGFHPERRPQGLRRAFPYEIPD